MARVLWIAPNLSHYKARFLNRLAARPNVELTVLTGAELRSQGHRHVKQDEVFSRVDVDAAKPWFGSSPSAFVSATRLILNGSFDWVLVPAEKKNIPLFAYLYLLKLVCRFRLITYCHAAVRSSGDITRVGDVLVTKFLFSLCDRVIFYTEASCDWAVRKGLLPSIKATYANNTLDTTEIWRNYSFEITPLDAQCLLFIGRLVREKKLEKLFEYYSELKKSLPKLRFIVVGDGPEAQVVQSAARRDSSIEWHGAIVEEEKVAGLMRQANLVFVTGRSGLSIVHAFAYGKPYSTLRGYHGPEIVYLRHGENGLLLSGTAASDCQAIRDLLTQPQLYADMCSSAYSTAKGLSVEQWLEQVTSALLC